MLRCKRWFYDACETHNPNIFTQAINAIIDPFERELSVTHMHEVILRESAIEGIPMNAIMMEKIEDDFRRIIRRAQADQLLDTMDVVEEDIKQPVTPVHASVHIQCMEDRMTEMEKEIARLKNLIAEKMAQQPSQSVFTYIRSLDFKPAEETEREFCAESKRGVTALARYMRRAEQLGSMNFGGASKIEVLTQVNAHLGTSYSYDYWKRIF